MRAKQPVRRQREIERFSIDPAYREKRREYGRTNYRRHKAAYVARATARDKKYKLRRGRGKRFDKRDAQLLWVVQSGLCFWCDVRLDQATFHLDHLIPLSKGGKHERANFVLSCPTCNLRKHALLPLAFAARVRQTA